MPYARCTRRRPDEGKFVNFYDTRVVKALDLPVLPAIIYSQIDRMLSNPKLGVTYEGRRWVWISQEELADITGIHIASVRRYLKLLQQRGYILASQRPAKNRSNQTRYYAINWNRVRPLLSEYCLDLEESEKAEIEDNSEEVLEEQMQAEVVSEEKEHAIVAAAYSEIAAGQDESYNQSEIEVSENLTESENTGARLDDLNVITPTDQNARLVCLEPQKHKNKRSARAREAERGDDLTSSSKCETENLDQRSFVSQEFAKLKAIDEANRANADHAEQATRTYFEIVNKYRNSERKAEQRADMPTENSVTEQPQTQPEAQAETQADAQADDGGISLAMDYIAKRDAEKNQATNIQAAGHGERVEQADKPLPPKSADSLQERKDLEEKYRKAGFEHSLVSTIFSKVFMDRSAEPLAKAEQIFAKCQHENISTLSQWQANKDRLLASVGSRGARDTVKGPQDRRGGVEIDKKASGQGKARRDEKLSSTKYWRTILSLYGPEEFREVMTGRGWSEERITRMLNAIAFEDEMTEMSGRQRGE